MCSSDKEFTGPWTKNSLIDSTNDFYWECSVSKYTFWHFFSELLSSLNSKIIWSKLCICIIGKHSLARWIMELITDYTGEFIHPPNKQNCCYLTEYAKWFWASPYILTGEPRGLRRTFWDFAGHFMSGEKENLRRTFLTFRQQIEFLCWTFCSNSLAGHLKISLDMSGETGEFRVLWSLS